MAEKNLALQAFREHFDALYSSLTSHPDLVLGLASKVCKGAIIVQETRDVIKQATGTVYQASRLLSAIESAIAVNPKNLRRFLRILRKESTLKSIAGALRKCYGKS